MHTLAKLLGYSGNNTRSLIIKDASALRLANPKIHTLLRGSRKLEFLEIHNELEPLSVDTHQWPPTLTHLVLDQVHVPGTLWEAVAGNIEYLHLSPKAPNSAAPQLQLPVLPKLRQLHIVGTLGMLRPTVLPGTMPNLEQLWFSNLFPFADYGIEGERTIKETFNEVWKGMKAVIVNGHREILDLDQAFGFNSLVSINRGENIRYIELVPYFDDPRGTVLLDRNRHSMELNDGSDRIMQGDLGLPNHFSNLEALRIKQTVMDGTALQPILRPALDNNRLRELDINFRRPHFNEPEGPSSCQHLKDYEWLRGARSIRSMRVSNFRFTRYPRSDDQLPLPGFLASFPNLEILEIGSEYYEDAEMCSVVVAVMKVTKLKRIYQSTIRGAPLDSLKTAAKEYGVQLVFGDRPREWPVVFENN
ncbi:F-box/TPR repeat protein Pof3 [Geosmithia morbida]|uniref:F-box/TPR repeat protein Pof3 n=1 Tax=Geosmithia morbida TaxID=1094350 RepID=A0A9P4Z1H1_9HYPO|nr:F-box/TPR repeat protein Pof3 [Geosmithia morbida]KAF4125681.1 F-box/TPR repeat protein Pof3 [Geosmithia morbida]